MENKPVMAAGPHIHSADSSRRIMLDVIIALLPASIAAVVLFGLQAALMICVCVAAAVVSEFLFNLIARRDQSVGDLSAVVTGLLLALNLSTNVPLWQCALGSVFAIVLVKCAFGGMGHNFANPAITARIFLLMAFTSTVAGGAMPRLVDAVSSATPLDLIGAEGAELPTLGQMFLGLRGGAIGEGCILALLIGFAYLLARKGHPLADARDLHGHGLRLLPHIERELQRRPLRAARRRSGARRGLHGHRLHHDADHGGGAYALRAGLRTAHLCDPPLLLTARGRVLLHPLHEHPLALA